MRNASSLFNNNINKAIKCYLKSIELKSINSLTFYNLGFLFDFLGLLSLVLPKTADNYLERIRRWAEDEKSC